MNKFHIVDSISFKNELMIIIIDGKTHQFLLKEISSRLAVASTYEREKFEISPSGYGIHWPLIDEDLSVDGLLGIVHQPKSKKETVFT